MQIVLRKSGNSTGLTFSPALLRDLGLVAGQVMTIDKTPDSNLLLRPQRERRKYTAAELNAQCNTKAPMPDDLVAWVQMPPMDNETL
jgi:antitoxin ChpS